MKGKDGKFCLAKTSFALTLGVFLIKVILSGVTYGDLVIESADYSGMSMLLGVVATTYWGRAHTKSVGE